MDNCRISIIVLWSNKLLRSEGITKKSFRASNLEIEKFDLFFVPFNLLLVPIIRS